MSDEYEMIRFTPDAQEYAPPFLIEKSGFSHWVPYDQVDIPLGKSRVGGPVVDLPPGFDYPRDLFFIAQLDMGLFSQHDKQRLLPRSGFLYFFFNPRPAFRGQAIYADVDTANLHRVVYEHDGWEPWGRLVDRVYRDVDKLSNRYGVDESGNRLWDDFAGADISKVFGIYCNMNKREVDVLSLSKSGLTPLLQLGEDFTHLGVFNVLINTQDLRNGDFTKCRFEWCQT